MSKRIQKVLDQLYQRTNYEHRRRPYNAENYSNETLLKLLHKLNNPHKTFKTIHIAGTKGKGSTAHYMALSMQAAGYRTGLYMSPSIMDLRDRFYLNMKKASWKAIIPYIERVEHAAHRHHFSVTVFGVLTAVAFLYFEARRVDIAIIETGMGGRLDCTNVVEPEAVIITTIGKDHEAQLGYTLDQIAYEKAGIIKHGTPVYFRPQEETVNRVIMKACAQHHAPLTYPKSLQELDRSHALWRLIEQLPPFQRHNCLLALSAMKGMNIAYSTKKWKALFYKYPIIGRFYKKGAVLYDVAHNVIAIKQLIAAIKAQADLFPQPRMHFIAYFLPDKNVEKILEEIPIEWRLSYYLLRLREVPDALEREVIRRIQLKRHVDVYADLKTLKAGIYNDENLIVSGSSRLVGYLLRNHHTWSCKPKKRIQKGTSG